MVHGVAQALAGLGGKKGYGHGDVTNPNLASTKDSKPSNFVRVVVMDGVNELGRHGAWTYNIDGKGVTSTTANYDTPAVDITDMETGDELVFFGVIRSEEPTHWGQHSASSPGQPYLHSRDISLFVCADGGLNFTSETDASQSVTRLQTVTRDDRDDYSDTQYFIVYLDLTP